MELKIKAVSPKIGREFPLPQYKTAGAAAMDLCACMEEDVTLAPGQRMGIPTGIAIALPSPDYAALVFVRSGMGFRHGIGLSNGVGVIDSDYRGEISVGLVNLSGEDYTIRPGDRIAQLKEDARQAKTDSEENQRLRDLNGLRQQRRDFTFEAARVIERSTSNWSRTLTLNKGTGLGVAIGDCVVDQYGYLVGVVTEAGANWCTVTTILDTDSQLGALVFRTGEVTVAMGDLALMGQGKLKLSYLEGESSLINGDMIVTSGLGGYYPSGLVIGSVEEIKTDDNGLTRYATIIPKTDITQLVEVFVITDFTIVD